MSWVYWDEVGMFKYFLKIKGTCVPVINSGHNFGDVQEYNMLVVFITMLNLTSVV